MTPEQIMARNRELEGNNRLLLKKIKEQEKIIKDQQSTIEDLESKVADIEDYVDKEFIQCESCGRWFDYTDFEYVGNERICEICRVDGYGR